MYGVISKLSESRYGKGRVNTHNKLLGEIDIYELPKNISIDNTVKFRIEYSDNGIAYGIFEEIADRNKAIYNTEDKKKWYKHGSEKELQFIENMVPLLDVDLVINPQKEINPTVIDFWDNSNNRPADLKVQNTPFFNADKYNYKGKPYNPTFTVTFNVKDFENYNLNYPNCDIYFWVHWEQLNYKNKSVQKINGIWRANFFKMKEYIEKGLVQSHVYRYRIYDNENAKGSYLFLLSDSDVFQRLL